MSTTRQLFEYWFSDAGENPRAVERSGEGYKLQQAQQAWNAWQAATAAERKACADRLDESAAHLLAPKRTHEIDRHTADVLQRHASAIRARSETDA